MRKTHDLPEETNEQLEFPAEYACGVTDYTSAGERDARRDRRRGNFISLAPWRGVLFEKRVENERNESNCFLKLVEHILLRSNYFRKLLCEQFS